MSSPANITLSRVRQSDFFSTIVPGFYLLGVISLCTISFTHNSETSSLFQLINQIKDSKDNWSVTLVAVLASYLLGIVLRAIPVNLADTICRPFLCLPQTKFDRKSQMDRFPYRKILKETTKRLYKAGLANHVLAVEKKAESYSSLLKTIVPEDGNTHTVFNYWKLVLCSKEPQLFDYSQSAEGRVRVFAGMFWAGACGTLALGTTTLIQETALWPALVLSIAILLAFGWNLRRVRIQEVTDVFISYIIHLETIDRPTE